MKTLTNKSVLRNLFAFLLVLTMLAACKKDGVDPKENNNYLTESQLITSVTKTQVLLVASQFQEVYEVVSTKDLLNVKVFKLNYKTTDVQGKEITASGVVIVPITEGPLPIISYQHGSIFEPEEAPSNYSTGMETRGAATILASAGYILSVPDYLGYGESLDYPHPYEHAKTLGSASYDMLMATKEFLEDNEIALSDKLFLTGYSEGGNATMALHKHIEENSDLQVTMSAPASGAYNKTAFAKDIVKRNEELRFLPRFMWVIDSYNWIYALNRNWSDFVNETDAAKLEAISSPFNLADAEINTNPKVLFTASTIDGILGSDTEFLNVLADNNNFNWKPNYPITLYYGSADDYVFPLNSETAYDALMANGATVSKVVYEGKDHGTAFIPYVLDVFELFDSLK